MAVLQTVSFDPELDLQPVLAWQCRDLKNPGKSDELGMGMQTVAGRLMRLFF